MGFISKLMDFITFKKDTEFDKEMKTITTDYGVVTAGLISFSNASYMASLAAKMCIGKDPDEDYEKRLEHIKRVVARGHESTIAHSNIIMLVFLNNASLSKFLEVGPALKFTNYSTSRTEEDSTAILIGGSIRAYKYFIRECKDLSNPICVAIKETLYQSAESIFFEDFIADGIMDKDKFRFYPNGVTSIVNEEITDASGEIYNEDFCDATIKPQVVLKGKVCDIVYSDDVYGVLDKVSQYGFTLRDVLKLTTCSVIFHNISRIISQQLTRHRAAISQESQRYVDYSKADFVDPTQFNEKYDPNKKYTIELGSVKYEALPVDIGKMILLIYPQLIEQGMLKQDGRSFLPMNVDTKLLMTFTIADLIHFIKERKANAAQPETHCIADELVENLYNYELTSYLFSSIGIDELIELIETPVYKAKVEEDLAAIENSIDEVISEEEI